MSMIARSSSINMDTLNDEPGTSKVNPFIGQISICRSTVVSYYVVI